MQWDDDIDLIAGKKSAPRQGRRSSKGFSLSPGDSEEATNDDSLPLRTKKTEVWSEEDTKLAKSKAGSNMIELERFETENIHDDDDDIPVIPDIDDLQDDPLNLPDVKPIVTVDKSTYKELDNQFDNLKSKQVNFGNLGDIDLSFLTNKLYPEKDVQLSNEVWTMESLFSELSKASD